MKLFLAFCLSWTCFAKAPARKPTQVAAPETRVKVEFGDKTTYFVITKISPGARIDFFNNEGAKSFRNVSASDYTFLQGKVDALTGTNSREFCQRNFAEITTPKRKVLGCLGAGNALARDVQSLVNLLASLF